MVVFITARALAFLSGNKNCQQLFVREFGLSELLIHFSKGKRPGSVRLDGLTQGGRSLTTPVLDCTIIVGAFHSVTGHRFQSQLPSWLRDWSHMGRVSGTQDPSRGRL